MAYDEKLAARVRTLFKGKRGLVEKKMFGGVAFMLKGKMCCGVLNNDLVARVGTEQFARALKKPHVQPMTFTGRVSKGFVYVGPAATKNARSLKRWVDDCVAFVATL